MQNFFRIIPHEAFGTKPIIIIRDINAVVHNYLLFKKKADNTNSICAAVLKDDVHGLLMVDVAPALYKAGARHFFVEELFEGIELREILPYDDALIYTMAGLLNDEEPYFKQSNISPCINCLEQLARWNNCWDNISKGKAMIHLDTHMNRLGMLDDEVELLAKNFNTYTSNLKITGYMSHFYDIKGNDHSNCYKQLKVMQHFLSLLPKAPVTFACTDSVILLDNATFNFDMIRPGIGLAGGAPNAQTPISSEAKHTFEVYTKISQIKNVKKGETIGYGGAYTTKRNTKLALAHIGYKDGYLRSFSEMDSKPQGVYMVIGNYKAPLIGKISLGISTIDVTDIPDEILKKFPYAEVVGPNNDLKQLADIGGCYEVLAALGRPNKKVANFTLAQFEERYS